MGRVVQWAWLIAAAAVPLAQAQPYPWQNTSLDVQQRVSNLVRAHVPCCARRPEYYLSLVFVGDNLAFLAKGSYHNTGRLCSPCLGPPWPCRFLCSQSRRRCLCLVRAALPSPGWGCLRTRGPERWAFFSCPQGSSRYLILPIARGMTSCFNAPCGPHCCVPCARQCERGDANGPIGMSFPSGVALGSTFNASLVTQVAYATAVEVRGDANTYGGGASW